MSIPVTLVAGFLGAGKTTLLNHLLGELSGHRVAVLVNDFGELDIDAEIVGEIVDNVYSLANGCICCSVQSDLLAQLAGLADLADPPEQLIIECSGVSDPQRIVQTLGYPQLAGRVRLDCVVTVVDAEHHAALEGDYAMLARAQVAAADIVVVNKIDLASAAVLDALAALLPPGVRRLSAKYGRVPPEVLLEPGQHKAHAVDDAVVPRHAGLFTTWHWTSETPLEAAALRRWLNELPSSVFRLKGTVWLTGRERPYRLHGVGPRHRFEPTTAHAADATSRLVVIQRRDGADPQRLHQTLDACRATQDAS
ncbi:CobW family GTP-binding protein [Halomonas smyrnensis]|uniref:CobW family GTP-binding protein n=1 Tax=Halomonas smyrnensis TaxID=720605 RepID=UPI0002F17931|nr:GTP-binding protein [Halomonas smyrnensis]